ncbi:MAG: hypothetical protein Q9220_005744 [cf. Caloplaca sp. 1 TL-2023]
MAGAAGDKDFFMLNLDPCLHTITKSLHELSRPNQPEETMESLNIDIVPTLHTHPTPALNPSSTKLRPAFTVLIIGASRGIGAHGAEAYARAGASTLILAARTTLELVEVCAICQRLRPGISVYLERCDVSDSRSVAAMVASIKKVTNNHLDVVIYNSGFAGPHIVSFTEGKADDFDRCYQVNTLGVYHAAHHLIPLLLAADDGAKCFVVVGAAAAWITEGPIANVAYCSSKLAQLRLVEMMSRQYKKEGLLSVAIHPGAVATKMAQTAPKEFVPFSPITSGTFSGPLLNATVSGGVAYPASLNNRTVQAPEIIIYGITADNASVLARISGVGEPKEQFARLTIEAGGKAAGLADEFLLASITPNGDDTVVAVDAYLVGG